MTWEDMEITAWIFPTKRFAEDSFGRFFCSKLISLYCWIGDADSDVFFHRKVYSILMVQLLVTVGFITLFTYHTGTKTWMRQNTWFYIVALVFFMGTVIAMSCCSGARRKAPGNFICLSIFTLAASVMAGAVSSTYK